MSNWMALDWKKKKTFSNEMSNFRKIIQQFAFVFSSEFNGIHFLTLWNRTKSAIIPRNAKIVAKVIKQQIKAITFEEKANKEN